LAPLSFLKDRCCLLILALSQFHGLQFMNNSRAGWCPSPKDGFHAGSHCTNARTDRQLAAKLVAAISDRVRKAGSTKTRPPRLAASLIL
jgi:hypothetical protein